MHTGIFNLIRVTLMAIFVLAFVVLCAIDQPHYYEEYSETSCLEPIVSTTAPTEPSTTSETEVPTDPTPAETEPTVATAPPTEPPPEPTETDPPETEPPYSEEELEMLALVIYQEAGADYYSDTTRLMVGTVVMNRIADERFPNTMYEVLTQESQYGRLHWTGLVWPKRASYPEEAHAVERAYEIAERILLGERALPADVIWQAEFVQGSEVVARSDDMYFCR